MKAQHVERFLGAARRESSASIAISIRLISVDRARLEEQIRRLQERFGAEISMTQPKQSGHGLEWIAYGTFI